MKPFIYCLLFLSSSFLFSTPPPEKEAFHLQRIIEFWKEKDIAMTQREIDSFITAYPESLHLQELYMLMGDSYYQQQDFLKSYQYYKRISDYEVLKKVLPTFLHALYATDQYKALSTNAHNLLQKYPWDSSSTVTLNFYLAEGLLRKNLAASSPIQSELQEALEAYKKVEFQPSYSSSALQGMALLHQLLNQERQAAAYIQALIKRDPNLQDKYTLTLASLQERFDKGAAYKSYDYLISKPNPYRSQAFINLAILHFDNENYEKVIAMKAEALQYLNKGQIGTYHYILGRSYYFQKQFSMAIEALKRAVKTPLEPVELQTAFLTLADCGLQQQDLELIYEIISSYERLLPKDESYSKIQFAKALVMKEKKHPESIQNYEMFIKQHPNFENLDKVMIDLALLYAEKQSYDQSREVLKTLTNNYPQSFYHQIALRQLINNHIKSYPKDNEHLSIFIEDLNYTLEFEEVLDAKEHKQALLQLGKLHVEAKNYQKATEVLNQFLDVYPNDDYSFEAHLLLSLCYQREKQDLDKYITHAESILNLNPKWDQNLKVHLNLFNSYLQMLQDTHLPDQKEKYRQLMATHLYKALPLGFDIIKKGNLLWLGNYYYQPIAQFVEENFQANFSPSQLQNIQKSIKAFEMALLKAEHLNISKPQEVLEGIKLSQLYGYLSLSSKKKQFLHTLLNHAQTSSSNERLLTLFELAKSAELQGIYQEAKKWYQQIIQEDPEVLSYLRSYSQLHLAKINFAELPKENRHLQNPEFTKLLNTLKHLSLNRSILFEPLHLEAALSYAEIRSLASVDPLNTHLDLLIKTKREFLLEDSVVSQDYHHGRKSLPKQDKIFQAYMLFIDARIQHLEAEIAANKQHNSYEVQTKLQAASSLYENLFTHKFLSTPFLFEKTQKALKDLKEKL